MKKFGVIALILALVIVAFFERDKNSTAPKKTAARSVKAARKVASLPARTSATAAVTENAAADNKESEADAAERAKLKCWDDLLKAAQKNCNNWDCVTENLKRKGSQAALFLEDGWIRQDFTDSSEMPRPSPRQRTTYGKMLYAMAQIGMVLAANEIPSDPKAGLKGLESLAKAEPENGFYDLMRSFYFAKHDQPEKSRQLLEKALAKKQFNTHQRELSNELILNNLSSMDASIMGHIAVSVLPIPNYLEWEAAIGDDTTAALSFGRKLLAEGVDTFQPETLLEWDPLMAAMGLALLRKAGDDSFKSEDWREMMRKSSPSNFTPTSSDEPDCHREQLKYMQLLKKYE